MVHQHEAAAPEAGDRLKSYGVQGNQSGHPHFSNLPAYKERSCRIVFALNSIYIYDAGNSFWLTIHSFQFHYILGK
jgi:hypothetical protein